MNRAPIIAMLAVLGFSGCRKEQWDDCFTGTGDIVLDERHVPHFTAIDLSDRFDLVIVPDTIDRVILETGQRLLEQIRTEVDGTALVIRDRNTCNWVRRFDVPMKVTVHCSDLRELICRGTGDVDLTAPIVVPWFHLRLWNAMGTHRIKVEADSVLIHANTGPGDVVLEGATGYLGLYLGARGSIDTRATSASVVEVNNSGVNDVHLRADDWLGAAITSSGNVYHSGPGTVLWTAITGSGQLIQED